MIVEGNNGVRGLPLSEDSFLGFLVGLGKLNVRTTI